MVPDISWANKSELKHRDVPYLEVSDNKVHHKMEDISNSSFLQVCVELVAVDKAETVQISVFLGSIRYEILRSTLENRVSL